MGPSHFAAVRVVHHLHRDEGAPVAPQVHRHAADVEQLAGLHGEAAAKFARMYWIECSGRSGRRGLGHSARVGDVQVVLQPPVTATEPGMSAKVVQYVAAIAVAVLSGRLSA